ncbi:MAG: pyridoxamine 5'-phosphate oxidase [bacterium]|nr:pyridoxamine 5'-phosphate oxidase [bacterium]
MNIETSRDRYDSAPLLEGEVAAEPLDQLRRWLDAAYAVPEIREPNAMCLSTVDRDGRVSSRMVLLRGLDTRGLVFYTSYFSRKARAIDEHPRVALTFYWAALHRQVRIEGRAAQVPEDESDAYFASRPRGHQLGAWASEQSEAIADRATLAERVAHFDARFEGEEVPRPHSWGGYVVTPEYVEFWQGQPNRLHDRLAYERDGRAWRIERLQP